MVYMYRHNNRYLWSWWILNQESCSRSVNCNNHYSQYHSLLVSLHNLTLCTLLALALYNYRETQWVVLWIDCASYLCSLTHCLSAESLELTNDFVEVLETS